MEKTFQTKSQAPESQVSNIIDPPLRLKKGEEIAWDDSADVVVVGFGGAGAIAALQAHEDGANVIIVDRFEGGGATAYSGGVFYAGGTPFQREAGFEDTAEEMFKYLSLEIGDAVSPATLRKFCEGSAKDLAWIQRHGGEYSGAAYTQKTSFPPEDRFLYYSGNENLPKYAAVAKPAPRGHQHVGSGWTGKDYFGKLRQAVEAAGIRVIAHSPAKRLVVDHEDRVVGIEISALPTSGNIRAKHQNLYRKVNPLKAFNSGPAEKLIPQCRALEELHGTRKLIRADGGVVIATGGFVYNLEMLERYGPVFAKNYPDLMRLGSMGCDGSGIQLGQSVGGTVGFMDSIFGTRAISPPNAMLKGVIVDANGERFIGEDAYAGSLGRAIAARQDGQAWLILESASYWLAFKQAMNAGGITPFMYFYLPNLLNLLFGGTKKARSIEKLAQKIGIPPQALTRTINIYNSDAATGSDPLGKATDKVTPIERGPFYAVNMSIKNRFGFTMAMSLGGLRVNEETGEVLREGGLPIKGLYAAGRAAVGVCSVGYFSGMALADGSFSGRRAGRHATSANESRETNAHQ
ncbi:MAG: FAD-binding protein [Sphingobium sp.]